MQCGLALMACMSMRAKGQTVFVTCPSVHTVCRQLLLFPLLGRCSRPGSCVPTIAVGTHTNPGCSPTTCSASTGMLTPRHPRADLNEVTCAANPDMLRCKTDLFCSAACQGWLHTQLLVMRHTWGGLHLSSPFLMASRAQVYESAFLSKQTQPDRSVFMSLGVRNANFS